MTDDPIAQVQAAFDRTFRDAGQEAGAMRLGVHPAWDSLAHMDLVLAVEKSCGVSFATFEIARLDSFGAIVAAVRAKRSAKADVAAPVAGAPRAIEPRVVLRREPAAVGKPNDPLPGLLADRNAFRFGPGRVGLGPLPSRIVELLREDLRSLARTLKAPPHRFPALLGADALERCGYVKSFPHYLTLAAHLREDRETIATFARHAHLDERGRLAGSEGAIAAPECALAPAVCYHVYAAIAGASLAAPYAAAAEGKCFRFESGALDDLRRLWDFSMSEVVLVGTQAEAVGFRQAAMDCSVEMLDAWGLAFELHTATDPFFVDAFSRHAPYQAAFELKFEASATLPYRGDRLAIASFNYHQDFFGRAFAIQGSDGGPAHTACAGFGLERFALAFLAQHGSDPTHWPDAIRRRYRELDW